LVAENRRGDPFITNGKDYSISGEERIGITFSKTLKNEYWNVFS